MRRGLKSPGSPEEVLARNGVNVAGASEVIWQPFYDYQTLSAAGIASQRFFVDPVGTAGKTIADTNMDLSGQLPKGQRFVLTGIQVEILPGVAIAATASDFADDVYDVVKGGALKLKIGSKDYVTQGNLMKFPPVNRLSTAAATGQAETYLYCTSSGREFAIRDLALVSNQNFSVELLELAALPSGVDARIGVTLNGYLYRNAQ